MAKTHRDGNCVLGVHVEECDVCTVFIEKKIKHSLNCLSPCTPKVLSNSKVGRISPTRHWACPNYLGWRKEKGEVQVSPCYEIQFLSLVLKIFQQKYEWIAHVMKKLRCKKLVQNAKKRERNHQVNSTGFGFNVNG
jgi:hypothetical protein